MNQTRRVAGLDLLRAIAISLVLLNHFSATLIIPHVTWARQWWLTGPLGVDLFFALSGFLIGRILLELDGTIGEWRVLVGFWGRRWLRTLPLYYLLLAANIVIVVCRHSDSLEILRIAVPYVYFGQSFQSRAPFFFSEAWSLAVEECFYLFFPLFWAGLIRLRMKPVTGFVLCCVFMLLLSVTLRLQLDPRMAGLWVYDVYGITVYRLDSIAMGVLAAVLSLRYPAVWMRWRYPGLVLGLVLLMHWRLLTNVRFKPPGFMLNWHFWVSSLGCVLVLPWCSLLKTLPSAGLERVVTSVARWSYALYLVHNPILAGAKALFADQLKESLLWSWFVTALVLAASLGVAAALHHWFERPFMALRDRWALTRQENHK